MGKVAATVAKQTTNARVHAGLPDQDSRELLSEQVASRFSSPKAQRMEYLLYPLEVYPTCRKNFRAMTKQDARKIRNPSIIMSRDSASVSQAEAVNSGQPHVVNCFAPRTGHLLELSRLVFEYPSTNQHWWKQRECQWRLKRVMEIPQNHKFDIHIIR